MIRVAVVVVVVVVANAVAYVQIFCTNVVSAAFSMYMLLEKSCQNDVHTKNLYKKC